MDRHIELSYCGFEAFKVLAKNFLDIDTHDLFETIRKLLEESNMTPADVAESLMPKTLTRDVETCLQNLIQALTNAKEAKTCGGEEQGCEKEDETSEGEEEGSKKDDESCEGEEGGEKEDSSCYSLSSAG
ncbi:hypothetical protein Vadar_010900 [Vaccinium darrowii]|uniref:Uncharacterized protein n=1 Tax=Vaccinium darrowii TaxID=229202 RepID=A0ACB7XY48_9ERIC|nr:hypothetical protein Vadar_010900 [Vaccinium darrowii]